MTADASEAMHVASFRAALRSFQHETERVARKSGLTPQRYLLLLMVKGASDGSGQTTVTELADRMKLAQSTVTELVKRAETAGLVEREQSEADARVAHIRLSAEGERRFGLVFAGLEAERTLLRGAFAELEA
jgi:DNA-binding MarR family transcriptional regulator